MTIHDDIRETVRERYASDALQVLDGGSACCGPEDEGKYGSGLYDALDSAELPDAARLASLGCGNPVRWTLAGFGSGDRPRSGGRWGNRCAALRKTGRPDRQSVWA